MNPTSIEPSSSMWEAYTRAERFLHWNVARSIYRAEVKPNWIGKTGAFWYRVRTPSGSEFVRVDPQSKTRRPAFDHVRLAAALSTAAGKACEPGGLPFETIAFVDEAEIVEFDAWEAHWRYNPAEGILQKTESKPAIKPGELVSPDGCWAAFVRENNLYVRAIPEGEEIALTGDGEPDNGYALSPGSSTGAVTQRLSGQPAAPVALWSPDSTKLLTHRLDQRMVKDLALIQHVPTDGSRRPVAHTYKYAMPGDERLAETHLLAIDVRSRQPVWAASRPLLVPFISPLELQFAWWGAGSRMVYYLDYARGNQSVRFYQLDTQTGETRCLLEESSQTYLEPTLTLGAKPDIRVLEDSQELLWFSERDGWAHLYLYDLSTGQLKRQVTQGTFVVREIKYVDETGRWVYFLASGSVANRDPAKDAGCSRDPAKDAGCSRDPAKDAGCSRDPYRRQLYRASLEGGELELLTPEGGDHEVTFSPEGACFVDAYGRADLAPVSLLRSAAGELLVKLEDADLSRLFELGWQVPERFSVKAQDGVTDLYGLLYKPTHFDPAKRYPVIDAVYPGPQHGRVPNAILPGNMGAFYWDPQALAELGFIVVAIDSFGTPYRSKAFHDTAYGKLGEVGGLVEHIPALRQLAARRPYLDLERVGIYGHSGGGYASTRAMLTYPDFYKVAVSSAGNHDNRGYVAGWGEKYHGLVEGDNYANQDNPSLAANLKGHLLLVHGDMDDNVHPALTLQVVDALIKANKDFDLLILPNRNHLFSKDVYFYRKLWDYFVKHLLGVEPPKGYQIQQ